MCQEYFVLRSIHRMNNINIENNICTSTRTNVLALFVLQVPHWRYHSNLDNASKAVRSRTEYCTPVFVCVVSPLSLEYPTSNVLSGRVITHVRLLQYGHICRFTAINVFLLSPFSLFLPLMMYWPSPISSQPRFDSFLHPCNYSSATWMWLADRDRITNVKNFKR